MFAIIEEQQEFCATDFLSADAAMQVIEEEKEVARLRGETLSEDELMQRVEESNPEPLNEVIEKGAARISSAQPIEKQLYILNCLLLAIVVIQFLKLLFK